MSETNVELHRRVMEAFNARDLEALTSCCDPRIEFHPLLAASLGGETVYQGHDGMHRWHRDFEEVWDEIRVEPENYFDLGEHTLVFHVVHARGRQSSAEVTKPEAQVARWRDGLCVYWKSYQDRDEALCDLGVTEDELEPIAP